MSVARNDLFWFGSRPLRPLLCEPEGQVPALRVAPEAAGGTFVCARTHIQAGQDVDEHRGRQGGGLLMKTRMRNGVLVALCAMLLGLATVARAGIPDRPIDRPGGPDPEPVMVGDPDAGNEIVVVTYRGYILQFRLPRWVHRNEKKFAPSLSRTPIRPKGSK